MRDLEIRGAGDILGTRQHGHIASVGFHLYTRLLAEVVADMRKQHGLDPQPINSLMVAQTPQVSVDLPLQISLPAEYVPDKNMRLRLYRRLADLRFLPEVDAISEEFTDRFGIPPAPVRNLLFQLKIKLLAEAAGVSAINAESSQIAIRFKDGGLPGDLSSLPPEVRVGKTALWISFKSIPDWRNLLLHLLEAFQPQTK
jgi:transcription-repair coupling factor (superfamily II helicase)